MSPSSRLPASPSVTKAQYQDALAQGGGWCTVCEEFTKTGLPSETFGDTCPSCHWGTVYAVERALAQGLLSLK